MDLDLLQREAGKRIGVTGSTVVNWELNHTEPEVRHWPAIIDFLGYNPLPEPNSLPELIPYAQRVLGISLRGMAERLGTDECCLINWRDGKANPMEESRQRLARLSEVVGSRLTS